MPNEQAGNQSSQGTVDTSAQGQTSTQTSTVDAQQKDKPDLFGLGYGKGLGIGQERGENNILDLVRQVIPEISRDNLAKELQKRLAAKSKEIDKAGDKSSEETQKLLEEKDKLIREINQKHEEQIKTLIAQHKNGVRDGKLISAAVQGNAHRPETIPTLFMLDHKVEVDDKDQLHISTLDGKPIIYREGDKSGNEMTVTDAMQFWLNQPHNAHLVKAASNVAQGSGTRGSTDTGTTNTKTYRRSELREIKKDPVKWAKERESILAAQQAGRIINDIL